MFLFSNMLYRINTAHIPMYFWKVFTEHFYDCSSPATTAYNSKSRRLVHSLVLCSKNKQNIMLIKNVCARRGYSKGLKS